jgi:hypothetical protein
VGEILGDKAFKRASGCADENLETGWTGYIEFIDWGEERASVQHGAAASHRIGRW